MPKIAYGSELVFERVVLLTAPRQKVEVVQPKSIFRLNLPHDLLFSSKSFLDALASLDFKLFEPVSDVFRGSASKGLLELFSFALIFEEKKKNCLIFDKFIPPD